MREQTRRIALAAKGFLAEREGERLHELARACSSDAPLLEIGSYCGKSGLFLGEGCHAAGRNPVFTVDHHRGSAEQQPGELCFDPGLYDERTGSMTTLTALVANIRAAGLEDWVIPIVAESTVLGRLWPPDTLALLFIDGGHARADAFGDYHAWSGSVRPGGYLCIHDVFPDPRDGGPAPYELMREATSAGSWELVDMVESLATLRRR
jgi:predicted O-methyltransferase YrrM